MLAVYGAGVTVRIQAIISDYRMRFFVAIFRIIKVEVRVISLPLGCGAGVILEWNSIYINQVFDASILDCN